MSDSTQTRVIFVTVPMPTPLRGFWFFQPFVTFSYDSKPRFTSTFLDLGVMPHYRLNIGMTVDSDTRKGLTMITKTEFQEISDRVMVTAPLDHRGLSEQFALRHYKHSVDVGEGKLYFRQGGISPPPDAPTEPPHSPQHPDGECFPCDEYAAFNEAVTGQDWLRLDGRWSPTKSAYAFDSVRGRWMSYSQEKGWAKAKDIFAAVANTIEEVCALNAKRLTYGDGKTEEDEEKQLVKLRQRWMTMPSINAVCQLAAELLAQDTWDTNRNAFGLPNGKSAHFGEGYPAYHHDDVNQSQYDYLTKYMGSEPAPETTLWKDFVSAICG